MSAIARGVLLKEECQIRNFYEKLSISCAALDSGPIKWSKKKKKFNLRNDAVPAVTFILAILEYCCRALARWTAAVSTADMLRKPAKLKNWKTLDKRTENASPINKFKRKMIFVFFFHSKQKVNFYEQPRTGGSRLATGIPLRFRLYVRGNDGARCNFPVINKFSVLVDAVYRWSMSKLNCVSTKHKLALF